MNKVLALITMSLFPMLGGTAIAQERERGGDRGRGRGRERLMSHPVLLTLDVNGDGVVTKNEWEQAPELLQKLDANGDFTLTREEMRSVEPPARNTRERPGRRRSGRGGPRAIDIPVSAIELGEPGIAWYGRLDLAKEEAKRSNRPIMFMAAASQCGGVPGVF